MKPTLESIERDMFGCYFISILYPKGLYTYKLTSARDVDLVRYYASRGYTNRLVKLVKSKEIIRW